ncbi:hypothetical protein BC833DRAFT_622390 [Globomyces pollinis-pini]|nr:hypothetical protein BC833DRAFT_622390 [Globomyces pollinis-pini]
MLFSTVFLVSITTVLAGVIPSSHSSTNPYCKPKETCEINPTLFAGVWYEIGTTDLLAYDDIKCKSYNYTFLTSGNEYVFGTPFNVTLTAKNKTSNAIVLENGTGKFNNSSTYTVNLPLSYSNSTLYSNYTVKNVWTNEIGHYQRALLSNVIDGVDQLSILARTANISMVDLAIIRVYAFHAGYGLKDYRWKMANCTN